MKILVVSNMFPNKKNPSYGIFVKRFCDDLGRNGIKYDTITITKSKSKLVKLFKYFRFYFLSMIIPIFKRYDCVYIHYASYSSVGVVLSSFFKKNTIIVNVHGSDVVPENEVQKIMGIFTKKILSISSRVVVPSNYFKRYVIKKYQLNDKSVEIYPSSGVDREVFKPLSTEEKKEFQKKFQLESGKINVGFVGRISEGKGWDTYLDAIRVIANSNLENRFQFILVGSGAQEKSMEKKIRELNSNVHISRFPLLDTEKLMGVYNVLDVLVFPTRREGESLGLVAIEAMSCGTPVIATDFAAPSEFVINGFNGYKFAYKSSESLAEKILKYSELDKLQVKKLEKGSITTANEFDRKKISKRQLDLLRM